MENDKDRSNSQASDRNKAATEKMAANDERQSKKQQSDQDKLTRSVDPESDSESLSKQDDTKNSISVKEKNAEKLKNERDKDFGIE